MFESVQIYPPPALVDIGNNTDNDPPVFEPVEMYRVKNAIVTPYGYIVKNFRLLTKAVSFRHRSVLTLKNIALIVFFKKKVRVNQPVISITQGWYDGYYHFTLESLPKLFLLKDYLEEAVLVFPKKTQQYHVEWLQLLGVRNILYLGDNEVAKTPLAITTSFPARDLNHHHIITPLFRSWVLSKISNKNSSGHQKIFIGRKNPRHRKLLNISDVTNFLTGKGFVYIEMEDFTVEDQVKLFYNATEIICVHGAALSNICFSKPGTKVLDMIHEDFQQWCFLKLAKILDINYSLLKCSGNNAHPLPGYRDLEVNLQQLEERLNAWK